MGLAIGFCVSAYGQSLSFNQIYALRGKRDAGEFLTKRSFTVLYYPVTGHDTIHYYVLNEGSSEQEKIDFDYRSVGYSTFDSNNVESLLKQIQNKYHKIAGYDEPEFKFYQFGDTQLVITVDISKKRGQSSSVSIVWQ